MNLVDPPSSYFSKLIYNIACKLHRANTTVMTSAIVPSREGPVSAADELSRCNCGEAMKQPRLLDCLHVLGACCVNVKDESNVVTCPVCQVKTQVPSDDVELLPEPRFLHVLAATERQGQGKRPLCEHCDTSEHEATAHCEQCAEFVCEKATTAHKEFKFMKNHNIVALAKFDATSAPSFESICRTHDQLFKFFCGTCDKLLCYECKDQSHSGHQDIVELNAKITEISTALEAAKEKLEATTKPLKTSVTGSQPLQGSLIQKAAAEIEEKVVFVLNQEEYLLRRSRQILQAGSKEERIMLHRLLLKPRSGVPRVVKDLPDATLVYVPSIAGALSSKSDEFEIVLCVDTEKLSDTNRKKYIKPGARVLSRDNLEAVLQSIENDVALVSGPNAATINQPCGCYETGYMIANGYNTCSNCGAEWGVALASLRLADRYLPLSEL